MRKRRMKKGMRERRRMGRGLRSKRRRRRKRRKPPQQILGGVEIGEGRLFEIT